MSFPSKFTSFDNSILAKVCYLIIEGTDSIPFKELVDRKLKYFEDISELLLALDVLFVLGKVELIDDINGVIKYVN